MQRIYRAWEFEVNNLTFWKQYFWGVCVSFQSKNNHFSALTGGTSLGQIELKVQTTADNLKFDSCKHTLSIPSLINSEELLYKLLEGDILTFPDV